MHQVIERIDFDAFIFKNIKGESLYILIEAHKFCNNQLKPGNLIMKKNLECLQPHHWLLWRPYCPGRCCCPWCSFFFIWVSSLYICLLSIFNKFGRKKRQRQREDTQIKKGKTSRATTSNWIMRSSKQSWCGCKHSKSFLLWE